VQRGAVLQPVACARPCVIRKFFKIIYTCNRLPSYSSVPIGRKEGNKEKRDIIKKVKITLLHLLHEGFYSDIFRATHKFAHATGCNRIIRCNLLHLLQTRCTERNKTKRGLLFPFLLQPPHLRTSVFPLSPSSLRNFNPKITLLFPAVLSCDSE